MWRIWDLQTSSVTMPAEAYWNLIGGGLVKRLMRKKSLTMSYPTVCCNLLHRNVLFVPAPTERVWAMGILTSTLVWEKAMNKREGKTWAVPSLLEEKNSAISIWKLIGSALSAGNGRNPINFKSSIVRPTPVTFGFSTQKSYYILEVHGLAEKADRCLLWHLNYTKGLSSVSQWWYCGKCVLPTVLITKYVPWPRSFEGTRTVKRELQCTPTAIPTLPSTKGRHITDRTLKAWNEV